MSTPKEQRWYMQFNVPTHLNMTVEGATSFPTKIGYGYSHEETVGSKVGMKVPAHLRFPTGNKYYPHQFKVKTKGIAISPALALKKRMLEETERNMVRMLQEMKEANEERDDQLELETEILKYRVLLGFIDEV